MKHDEAVKDIDSLDKIDEYSYKAYVIPECITLFLLRIIRHSKESRFSRCGQRMTCR
nr:MAG TPA: hypothetical protein [Caudoviricetes sp.]DAY73212.1 MAG TPA: hypothetical protein [Caudoviricetes sp.]